MHATSRFVRWFATLGSADVPGVGGRNASLGERDSRRGARGVRVPNGLVLTVGARRRALPDAGARPERHLLLGKPGAIDVAARHRMREAETRPAAA